MKRYNYIKYMLDFLFALIFLLLTFWVMLLCALAVKLDDPKSPAMYNTNRIGKDLKPFKMYKLRTMKPDCEGAARVTADTLTRTGKILRKLSLDELPQLFNILKGDMSFIGPRPLTERYIPWYTKKQNLRHSVRPGLTGLAQINGRVNLRWDKRFEYDIRYVESLSLKEDLKIFFLTFLKTYSGDGAIISDDGAERFDYFDEFQRDQIARGLVSAEELVSYDPKKEKASLIALSQAKMPSLSKGTYY